MKMKEIPTQFLCIYAQKRQVFFKTKGVGEGRGGIEKMGLLLMKRSGDLEILGAF